MSVEKMNVAECNKQ